MRKMIPLLLALVLVLLLAGCTPKVTVGAAEYPVDSTALDLSGTTLTDVDALAQFTQLQTLNVSNTGITGAQYDALCAKLPNCQITWTPLFQGKAYPADTTALAVTELTGSEAAELAYFPKLQTLDATGCSQYDALLEIMTQYPDLQVDYVVVIGEQNLMPDTTEAAFTDPNVEELTLALKMLPELKKVELTGVLPAIEEVNRLREAYPAVQWAWEVQICGNTYPVDVTEIDLSGNQIEDLAQLEAQIAYLPQLQKVRMCDCGISNEEMDALNRRYENISFVWNVTLGPYITVPTDLQAFNVFLYKYQYYLDDEAAYNLRYCTEMVCLDLGHQKITNCDFVAYMPNLKYLVLADTDVSDLTPLTGLKNLLWLEIFLCPIEDISPLTTVTSLEDLNLGYTPYEDDTALRQMTWLKRLWWSHCRLSMDEREVLRAALPNTEIVTNQPSSTGGTWRKGENYYAMRDMLGLHYMVG